MTEAMRRYLMPVFAPEDGSGTDGDVLEKPEGATDGGGDGGKDGGKEAGAAEGGGDGEKAGQADAGAEGGKQSPPDNWRDMLTGGNEDIAKLINRYGSPANVGRALLEKEKQIRESGGKTKAIERPADASDEKAMAEWRKSIGIPDDPTGYKLPDDVTKALTDEDKPVLAEYTEVEHKEGMTPDGVVIAAKWYTTFQEKVAEAQNAADLDANDKCEDKLRAEWAGAEYKGNLNLATRFIEDKFGLPFKEFADARLPDGRRLGSIPEFVMKLSDQGRESFGDAVFANTDAAKQFDDRKAEIQKAMREDIDKYYADGLDKEYAEILKKEESRKK